MMDIDITDATYKQLDRYRLRECVDGADDQMTKWTESWEEFFQRQIQENVFTDPKDIRDPDEIDVSDVEMLEE